MVSYIDELPKSIFKIAFFGVAQRAIQLRNESFFLRKENIQIFLSCDYFGDHPIEAEPA